MNRHVLAESSSKAAHSSKDARPKVTYYNSLVAAGCGPDSNTCTANWSLKDEMPAYGVPTLEKTFMRGIQANKHIGNEIIELCEIIKENGTELENDGRKGIRFKTLFEIYTKISNKLVGLLLRARKHGLVEFEGEMLFQGRDDNVLIKLNKK